jgi:hypothetical protein
LSSLTFKDVFIGTFYKCIALKNVLPLAGNEGEKRLKKRKERKKVSSSVLTKLGAGSGSGDALSKLRFETLSDRAKDDSGTYNEICFSCKLEASALLFANIFSAQPPFFVFCTCPNTGSSGGQA